MAITVVEMLYDQLRTQLHMTNLHSGVNAVIVATLSQIFPCRNHGRLPFVSATAALT